MRAKFSKPMTGGLSRRHCEGLLGSHGAGSTSLRSGDAYDQFTPRRPLNGFVKYDRHASAGTDSQGHPAHDRQDLVIHDGATTGRAGSVPVHVLRRDGRRRPSSTRPTARPLTLGVRFASSQDGQITGMKFYKSPDNTGSAHG